MLKGTRNSLFLGMSLLTGLACVPVTHAQGPTPGQNVNMVSGTKWPGGDPFLQRQNEPSIAVSTRNPQHLLAGANDYRTVDLPLSDVLPAEEAGDAWLGIFKSFDGGASWQSTLIPGFPQDASAAGMASPMKDLPPLLIQLSARGAMACFITAASLSTEAPILAAYS